MPTSVFSPGERVVRINDGAAGIVETAGPGASIGVRWDSSGVIQMVMPSLLKRG
ncbi:MAG: hypothetical protein ACLGI5_06240 [Thermoleophilia bacterium]